ncbi:MAG: 6-phosphogluconolactonase [Alphaproteobacteria bacterium]|nr:6-phosphogluconolactonase [Alphaproteobacteria bacterium]MBV9695243.1 6-phosphogluconolactonase [Alphaproteobacteria bacterium]
MIIEVLPDAEALAQRAARWFAGLVTARPGPLAVALSGGSTPKATYRHLAAMDLPWERIHWFWGDERFVPPNDPLSNFGMAQEAMLWRAPPRLVHPVPTMGLTAIEAAQRYEQALKRFFGEFARFDVTFLGLGPDGHTASLFPGSAALEETRRWCAAVEGLGQQRITLTLPALNASAHAVFLVSGAEKRAVLQRLLAGDESLPATRIRPQGELRFFVDSPAAP